MALPSLRTFATDICETSSTLGSGTYSLNGARTGYRSFGEGYDTNDTPYYVVRSADDTKYEHNRGGVFTDSSPDTLSRNVLYSSNGNAPVVWVSGDLPLNVYVPNAAEVFELLVRGWVADTRDAWLKFGHWFDSSVANVVTWKLFDGANDIDMGDIDLIDSTFHFKYMPAGAMMPYAGATCPDYFLFCLGQSLLRADYPELFTAIGTTHGAVDGTHFTLPDMRGRVPVGHDPAGTAGRVTTAGSSIAGQTLGATGGAQNESASVSVSGTVTVGGGATGSLTVNVGGTQNGDWSSMRGANGTDGPLVPVNGATSTVVAAGSTSGSLTVSANGGNSMSGSTSTATNMQPSVIMNYIISTGGRN
jgi:microcystin-dependent protein